MTSKFSFILTESLYLEANRLNYWVRVKSSTFFKVWCVAVCVALVVSFGCIFAFANQPYFRKIAVVVTGSLAAWMVATIILALVSYMILPRQTRKLLSQQKLLQSHQNFEITDDSLNMTNEYSNATFPYHFALKWAENGKVFLVYHSDMTFNLISKDDAGINAIDDLRNKLQRAGIEGLSL